MTLSRRSLAVVLSVGVGGVAAVMLALSGYTDAAVAIATGSGLFGGWFAKSSRVGEWLTLAAALVFLGVTAMQWQIADAVTVFGLLYAQDIAWTFQVAVLGLAAALAISQWRSVRWHALRPLVIWAAAFLAWAVVPWTDINLAIVWRARRAGFEQVVASVRTGQLTGHGLTKLPA